MNDAQSDIEKIYNEFRGPLKTYIQKRVSDSASAEDLLHDVFLKIHHGIGSLQNEEKLAPWIYQIARNSVVDFYRKRKDAIAPTEELAMEATEINEASERLAPVVRRMAALLPKKYRDALILSDFQSMKQKQIAERLNISLPGAKSRVQRARKMLKDLLLACCHFEFDRYGTVFAYHPKNCQNCCSSSKC